MSHPSSTDLHQLQAFESLKLENDTTAADNDKQHPKLSHSLLRRWDTACDKERQESDPGEPLKGEQESHVDTISLMKRKEVMKDLKTYGLNDRQLHALFAGEGYGGMDRYSREPDDMVLVRIEPSHHARCHILPLIRDTAHPHSDTHSICSSWIDVSGSQTPDEERNSASSSFCMVEGDPKRKETFPIFET